MAAEARKTGIDMGDLKDLAPLAQQLNAATDSLNEALGAIEDALNRLAIGLEVWVATPLVESEWRNVLNRQEKPTGERERDVQELGYGRTGDGWALLVRGRREKETWNESGARVLEWFDDGRDTKPLLRAARSLRLGAVRLIPQLLDAMKAEAERSIKAVEEARRIAESLE